MRETVAKARIVFAEEFRRQIRSKGWLILTFAVPMILLLLVIIVPIIKRAVESEDKEPDKIGYMDLSGELEVAGIAEKFPALVAYEDTGAGVAALSAEEIDDFFVVLEEYLGTGQVDWLYSGRSVLPREGASDAFRAFLRETLVAGNLEPQMARRVLSPASFDRQKISREGEATEAEDDLGNFVVSLIFGVLLLMAIFVGSGSLQQSISEEKENRLIEVLLTSISPVALLAGKVLALGATGLIQILVWIAAVALLGSRIFEQIPDLGALELEPLFLVVVVLFFVSGYLLFAVTMAGIGAATTSYREASSLSMFVIMPTWVPFWLLQPIINDPDGGLAMLLSYVPFTAPLTMMIRMGASDVPAVQVVGSLLVVFASSLVLLWVSARVFRAGLLMYGQRMGVRAVWRALRQAG
ncbi:MAG: ABC transporter permease [Chloroflexi bacterium]|nr:ABC transporter permease [Chloroflexota bacterium]